MQLVQVKFSSNQTFKEAVLMLRRRVRKRQKYGACAQHNTDSTYKHTLHTAVSHTNAAAHSMAYFMADPGVHLRFKTPQEQLIHCTIALHAALVEQFTKRLQALAQQALQHQV